MTAAGVRKRKIFLKGRRICFPWVPASARTRRPPRRGATSCPSNARYMLLVFSTPTNRPFLARLHTEFIVVLPTYNPAAFLPNVELGFEQQSDVTKTTGNAHVFCLPHVSPPFFVFAMAVAFRWLVTGATFSITIHAFLLSSTATSARRVIWYVSSQGELIPSGNR